MKKEIIISDIDFLKPDSDLLYSKNTIRNLLGNYYLIDKEQKYLLTRETIQNGEL
jgi:hypothetical protein